MPDRTNNFERYKPKVFFQEFLVDILGGLVPGVLFITGCSVALLMPIYRIYYTFSTSAIKIEYRDIIKLLGSFSGTPGTLWFFIFLGVFLLTYIVGHLFFRRDPKIPDRNSFNKLLLSEICHFLREISTSKTPTDVKRTLKKYKMKKNYKINSVLKAVIKLSIYPDKYMLYFIYFKIFKKRYKYLASRLSHFMSENYGADCIENCEFPYPDLHLYLKKRGLDYLLNFVVWSNRENIEKRSKVYINILKIRLSQFFPDKCKQMIRNEAHVRLASSSWYVSNTLSIMALLGLVLIFISIYGYTLIDKGHSFGSIFSTYFSATIFPFSVFIISQYFKSKINGFLHYQRMREVIFVLETAYTTFRFKKYNKLLTPPFKDVYEPNEIIDVETE